MTIEEKAKAYDKAIRKAKDMLSYKEIRQEDIEHLFSEIKESEDEKIRKGLINGFNECLKNSQYSSNAQKYWHNIKIEDIFTWLEKQGEQKSADNVEPKFKVGDWAVSDLDGIARQISEVHFDEYNSYYVVDGKSVNLEEYDRLHHLWTITDAKDGDILIYNDSIFIFDEIYENDLIYYGIYEHNKFHDDKYYSFLDLNTININIIYPATKEQRDTFERAMADAGYIFNFEKKELKKIEESENIKNQIMSDITDLVKDYITQKPVKWSEEDKRIWKDIIRVFKGEISFTSEKANEEYIAWLKSLKQRIGG